MTNIKFDIIKTRLTAPPRVLKTVWMTTARPKIKPQFIYQPGHPGGWIDGRQEGWYSDVDPQDYHGMREWCQKNLKNGTWYTGIYYIFLKRKEDVAWFMLRWS